MQHNSILAGKIKNKEFIVTAEFLPPAGADSKTVEERAAFFKKGLTAVNVADNPDGPVMSSLAGCVILSKMGVEPVFQVVTRDRNRIALQSDLLGAAALGIENVLCLSGHHQSLTGAHESANVYDIDSIQWIAAVKKMNEEGILLDGSAISGSFSMLVGAVASPDMKPLELNLLRLAKKVEAGARFIQTQAVFDTDVFENWLKEAHSLGITGKTAIIAGVMPLSGAGEAERLRGKYTDVLIPDRIIKQLEAAGDDASQKKEGLAICMEMIKKVRKMDGISGVHILSGGKENCLPEIVSACGL
jgi:methylenetetrahydrofolate reductase (NADPH)